MTLEHLKDVEDVILTTPSVRHKIWVMLLVCDWGCGQVRGCLAHLSMPLAVAPVADVGHGLRAALEHAESMPLAVDHFSFIGAAIWPCEDAMVHGDVLHKVALWQHGHQKEASGEIPHLMGRSRRGDHASLSSQGNGWVPPKPPAPSSCPRTAQPPLQGPGTEQKPRWSERLGRPCADRGPGSQQGTQCRGASRAWPWQLGTLQPASTEANSLVPRRCWPLARLSDGRWKP